MTDKIGKGTKSKPDNKKTESKPVKSAASTKKETSTKINASPNSAVVKAGNKVKVEYTGALQSGEIFDSSKAHGAPLEFVVASGQMIKGFDEAVIGMKLGEEKKITLPPELAYGERDPRMVQKVPKIHFPTNVTPEVGAVLMLGFPNGMRVPARIISIEEETITLDLNPPLAGKTLVFDIKIVEIE